MAEVLRRRGKLPKPHPESRWGLMRILITDGRERAALAAARALVAASCEVYVTARSSPSLAGVSRGVRSHVVRADALTSPARYAAEVGDLVGRLGIRVLIPVTDPSVEALLEHRDAVPAGVALPVPDLATWRAAADKLMVMELARAAGFDVPETVVLTSPYDAATVQRERLFPAVVKPHRSVVGSDSGRQKLGVSFVDDLSSCRQVLAALPATAYPVLLQRRVQGPGEGLFVLRWAGRVVALFAHRRLREKPPAGGVSVYRESIRPDPSLVTAGLTLLNALNWNGLVMIECKRDHRTGRHVIMEVNGRMWGSLQLAIDAGVNFPWLLVRCALGLPTPVVDQYRVGIRSRWLWGDVDHLYLRLRRSPAELHLPDGNLTRLAALRDFFAFRPGRDRCEILRWNDLLPFLVETATRMGLASGA